MADNFKPLQAQPFSLYGSGVVAGATTVVLKSFTQINGSVITMSMLGSVGFMTLEPGNGTLEEQISFTGVVQNANGTATLTGVKTVLFEYPYTQTSGLAQTHAGSTTAILSNTSGFYNQFVAKDDDGTVSETITFNVANYPQMSDSTTFPTLNEQLATKGYADSLTFAGAPDATTTQKGIVELATQAEVDAKTATGGTGASLVATPALARSTLLSDYVIDTGAADAYVITPSPAISAYATGQVFTWKSTHTNTTASTINVNGKGAKTIKKASGNDLVAGDIISGQIVMIEYDGTNFQLLSDVAPDTASKIGVQNSSYVYAASGAGTDTYAITVTPAPSAYAIGQVFYFKADVGNTGASTLNVNALGAIALKRADGNDTATGDILAGQIVQVQYDGTNFQIQSPIAQSLGSATGLIATVNTTTVGNNDETITLGFKPRTIQIFYFVQGHTPSGGTNITTNQKGVVLYNGTSLIANQIASGGLSTANTIDSSVYSTGIAESGSDGTSSGASYGSIIVQSVSTTGFVVRKRTNMGTGITAIVSAFYVAWA